MASRAWPKLYVMAHAAPSVLLGGSRKRPREVRRVLIAHHLLLGDTIMLTPLLKKARARFPDAELVMTVPRSFMPLYAGKPYGVEALPFDPRSLVDHAAMRKAQGFDLALVPGDNRWSWLARMLKARWVVAFAPERGSYKDWPVDELVRMPHAAMPWGDVAATLLQGDEPEAYEPSEWPAPPFARYAQPQAPYCVLHVGARTSHRRWPAENWKRLAKWAEGRGYTVVLSAGSGEANLLADVDLERRWLQFAGELDLAQLWNLLREAAFAVCPDTGIAHLARLVGVPTVAIYGPGSPMVAGPGAFWAHSPFRSVWLADVPCRDQNEFFDRKLTWVRHCWRSDAECGDPICIRRIAVDEVISAVEDLARSH
jgi:ADP-heptose:LPS heptosyltransferase